MKYSWKHPRLRSRMHSLLCALPLALLLASACNSKTDNGFPEGFADMADVVQVRYVMDHSTPDSTARFICLAALGKVPGARIDTLPIATLYAYENYRDSALAVFSDEYDRFSMTLPLADKMKILALAGSVDPQALGYELGLHYADQIREKNMTAAEVRRELAEFKKACADDPDTYERFLKGFGIVLKIDNGRDIPEEIYKEYI